MDYRIVDEPQSFLVDFLLRPHACSCGLQQANSQIAIVGSTTTRKRIIRSLEFGLV